MAQLNKELTTYGLTMIAIGACIGSGIFITPANSFEFLGHHGYVIFTWALGGFITFLGALTFSELGSRFPQAGGVYVFIKEAYGSLAGFLYGWITLLIVNTGALAALSVAFADYLGFFVKMEDHTKTLIAIVTILLLTGLNVIGVGVSQIFARLFTGLKLVALLLIILLGLYFYISRGSTYPLDFNMLSVPKDLTSMMLLAFVGIFWSFGGWHHATYLAGETKDPIKTVPRSMLYGTLTVTVAYILVILAYSVLLPMDSMINSTRIAGDAVANVVSGGGKLVALAIMVSIFGTIGIYTMSAPRIYFAMAKDGVFFEWLARIHPKYGTPHLSMIFQAIWASLLVLLWGRFVQLMTFVTFMDIVFMALATSCIFVFRSRKHGDAPSFKLKWYPLIPILYLMVTIAFVFNTLLTMRSESIIGLLILLVGIPVHYYFRKRSKID